MIKLKVKKLVPHAVVPTVAHPGEDLAYDLYAAEDVRVRAGMPTSVPTGIAVRGEHVVNRSSSYVVEPVGFIIKDRSSMAKKGVLTHGGVIDAGYRGEIVVVMSRMYFDEDGRAVGFYQIRRGDKIAQMIPQPVLTGDVFEVVDTLGDETARGEKGFGSSGR